jgi:cytochrome P450
MFSQKFLHVSDIQLAREILQKRPKQLIRSRVLDYMATNMHYLPFGLFHANDAVIWGKVRKQTSPAFSKQNLASMSTSFLEEALAFVQHLDGLCGADSQVDMIRENTGYTVRVISRVAFGNDTVEYFFGEQFYRDVRVTFDILLDSALFPFPQWVWRLSPKYQGELAAAEADKRFSAACQQVIDTKRRQQQSMSEDEKKDTHSLIDIMIRQEDARDEEVLANVKTFYLAGSDTTSMSMSWAMYLLAQHPGAVQRLREEVAGFFSSDARNRSAAEISEALGAMVYTHAVLKEAIRLYPAGPAIFLDFTADESITLSNGVVVTPDTTFLVNLWLPLTDEANFSDAKNFHPERWLTEDKALLGRMDQAFLGFGAGARACPGAGLAMAEGAMALAAVYHHFDVQLLCAPEDVKAEFKFTLQPSQLPVRLIRRAGITFGTSK